MIISSTLVKSVKMCSKFNTLTNQHVESLQKIRTAVAQEAQGFIRQRYKNNTTRLNFNTTLFFLK